MKILACHLTFLFIAIVIIIIIIIILLHVPLKQAEEYFQGKAIVNFREGYLRKSTWQVKNSTLFKTLFIKSLALLTSA